MARRFGYGVLAVIGWLLSPLSWWNDAFVNLPLAWLFASAVGLVSHRLFAPAMLLGYWLTNVLGILLMARGTAGLAPGPKPNARRQLVISLATATGYTLVILLLYRLGVLKPLQSLFAR